MNEHQLILSKSIKSTQLLKEREPIHRLTIQPFIFFYVTWIAWAIYECCTSPTYGIFHFLFELNMDEFDSFKNDFQWIVLCCIIVLHALSFLMTHWSNEFDVKCNYYSVKSVNEADYLFIIPAPNSGLKTLCTLQRRNITESKDVQISFEYQKQKYIYDIDKKIFIKTKWSFSHNYSSYLSMTGCSTSEDLAYKQQLYGKNELDVPIPTFQELFLEQATAPFFVFQLFCVLLWTLDDYWYHSLFTLLMLFVFESSVVLQRLKNLKELRDMTLVKGGNVPVYRFKKWEVTSTKDLVPGDIVAITAEMAKNEDGWVVPCDLLLLKGSCIVNEAMLSGESTPLLKDGVEGEDLTLVWNPLGQGRNHALFGGTKILQVTAEDASSNKPNEIVAPGGGCLAIVARTGFSTTQGKLVQTMYYNSERHSANNLEALLFILFLLIFALTAAIYVWNESLIEDPNRSRFKLLVKCLLIITAVVPPELPMELSLAVNTSLLALVKLAIFCTEPFRIPLAGKIDVTCFDKTGTLTDEKLVIKGICGLSGSNDPYEIQPDLTCLEAKVMASLAACHSLALLNANAAGDPMEKATLEAIHWNLSKGDHVSSSKTKMTVSIVKRFPFSSSLRRMAVIANSNSPLTKQSPTGTMEWFVAVKGAPEALHPLFDHVPEWYIPVYQHHARKGERVIALGWKPWSASTRLVDLKELDRAKSIEHGLEFLGFLIFHCPIKPDSKKAVSALIKSKHKVVIVSGDHPLTAVHVSKELGIANENVALIDTEKEASDQQQLVLRSWENGLEHSQSFELLGQKIDMRPLAVTGPAFEVLLKQRSLCKSVLLPSICVCARFSPSNKENLLILYKELGWTTLMCGDGTNDVGALKQAHIGVALLDMQPEEFAKYQEKRRTLLLHQQQHSTSNSGTNKRLNQLLQEMEDEMPRIKFGDASVAAPFTSKLSTIESVCHIIKQGRCTLVTTVQMFKILALNSLIIAYSLSVLQLAGVRSGDFQMTISGMLLAGCFLFLSRSKPLENLSADRPSVTVFTLYTILSILGQFAVHVYSLVSVVSLSNSYCLPPKISSDNVVFEPSLLNSGVYLLTLIMQISTFTVNYQGRPFRESLLDNIGLIRSILIVASITLYATIEYSPAFNEWLQLVPFPPLFRYQLLYLMATDFGSCMIIEAVCWFLFARYKPKWMS